MSMNRILAAGLGMAFSFGLVGQAFADSSMTTTTETKDSNYQGSVNMDVTSSDNTTSFSDRVIPDLTERTAPQVGQTRAAIEAIYGPAQTALAPNKDYDLYTNEYQMIDGKTFKRNLTDGRLKIYEVSYRTSNNAKTANDTSTDVKERVIPRLGDHRNLVTKLLGKPISTAADNGQQIIYGIPKQRYTYYNDVLSSPAEAVNTYFNADGFLVGQEFLPGNYQGQTAITSAGRYIEVRSNFQPDRKVAW